MNTHTIIRHIDEQGRIVLPIEIRKALGLEEGTLMELNCIGNNLILTKCYSTNNVTNAVNTISEWLEDSENKPQIMSNLEKNILTALLGRIIDHA